MAIKNISDRLIELGCNVSIKQDALHIEIDGYKISVTIDEEWKKSINTYFRARQYVRNNEAYSLSANKFIEFQITNLSPGFTQRPDYTFTDKEDNVVTVCEASNEFTLSLFCSPLYEELFDIIRRRIKRRCERKLTNAPPRRPMRFRDIALITNTATYMPKKKLPRDNLEAVGRNVIKACLFNLAYSEENCWELKETFNFHVMSYDHSNSYESLEIPSVQYNTDLVTFYKVAHSTQFSSQSFLSFYHILEYNFLKVADEILFNKVKTQLNAPNFKANYSNVSKLLSTVKKNDNTSDETEMLKAVLHKYVQEDDLIKTLLDIEQKENEKIYSKPKSLIFGEKLNIRLEEGHAISNTAKVIKHIRNSLVHSSDRYSREKCFVPFSESESTVIQFLPLLKYLAEKVIFSTAE